jgi:hypothetical protein
LALIAASLFAAQATDGYFANFLLLVGKVPLESGACPAK